MKKTSNSNESRLNRPIGTAYLIGRLDHVLSRMLRDAIAPLGLTVNQYTALSALAAHDCLSNAQMAERSMVSPQAANEMVKTMEGRGWIERAPDPSHGRIIRLRVTDTGRALLQQCDAEVARLEAAMLADIPEQDRAVLQNQLRTILRTLRALIMNTEQY